jgi:NitT/TauT family transport system ATP-binding protein
MVMSAFEKMNAANSGHKPVIRLNGVHKAYPTADGLIPAIDNVSFTVPEGEFVSILGPSGCGKTTLMMIIAGLRHASGGGVYIDERPVKGPQTNVGIVFQTDVLLDWRTALDNVLLQVKIRKLPLDTYRDKGLQLLSSAGLGGFEHRYPYELSGGMRQRVSICRALVHDPSILLMDEPFGALDALTREQMQEDLQSLWMTERKTVIFITHSIPEAVFLSDRIIVMTHRPGQLDRVVGVDLPRPRDVDTMTSPNFTEYVREIRYVFRPRAGTNG